MSFTASIIKFIQNIPYTVRVVYGDDVPRFSLISTHPTNRTLENRPVERFEKHKKEFVKALSLF